MSREGDEELLFEFACWNDDIRNTRGIPTLMDRVRAFLASREPAQPNRYDEIAQAPWFREAYEGKSLGDVIPVDPEPATAEQRYYTEREHYREAYHKMLIARDAALSENARLREERVAYEARVVAVRGSLSKCSCMCKWVAEARAAVAVREPV